MRPLPCLGRCAVLVETVAISVVSVSMDSILAIGITVSRLGCAKKFKNRKNKIENPLRAAPEKPPRAPAAPCTTAGSLG